MNVKLTKDQIIRRMRYLGFITENEDGTQNELSWRTAEALHDKHVESVMLPSAIATEYGKQKKMPTTNAKLNNLICGGQEIVDPAMMDEFAAIDEAGGTNYVSEIRTCRNRRQVGTRDVYVAWIHNTAVPKDLTFHEGYAIGSKDKEMT